VLNLCHFPFDGVFRGKHPTDMIRDKKDYATILNYIYTNPIKHGLVGNIEDWKYSSFA